MTRAPAVLSAQLLNRRLECREERDSEFLTTMKYALLLAAASVVLLGLPCGCDRGGVASSPAKTEPPLEVKTVRPFKGAITRNVTLPGEVKAYQQATLYAKVAGYLKTISVDKGDRVKEGDLIADIEVPEMLADLTRYKAEVTVAELDYKRLNESQKKVAGFGRAANRGQCQGQTGRRQGEPGTDGNVARLRQNHCALLWRHHEAHG